MQRINETVGSNTAEVYQLIQQKISNNLKVEYIYHTNRLEGSQLTKWATAKVLKDIAVDNRSRSKDILAAQNHPRAIKFLLKMAAIPNYNISEADIKNLHFMLSEHLVADSGEYRTDDDVRFVSQQEIPRHTHL